MKVKPICYVLIGIIIFAAVFLFISLSYGPIKVKLLPSLSSGFVLVLSAILLGLELSSAKKKGKTEDKHQDSSEEDENEAGESKSSLVSNLISFAWLVGLVAGIYLVGFLFSIPVWIISYLKVRGKGWLQTFAIAIGTTGMIYVLFIVLLQANLYEGIILKALNY